MSILVTVGSWTERLCCREVALPPYTPVKRLAICKPPGVAAKQRHASDLFHTA